VKDQWIFTDKILPFTDSIWNCRKKQFIFESESNSYNLKIMKMGAGVFWGVLLVLIGFALIIRFVFNVDFPVFKVLFAMFFIYIGLRILFGSFGLFKFESGPDDVLFAEREFYEPENNKEYNVVFGQGNFDFTNVDLSHGNVNIKIGTVFGGTKIKIDRDMPVKIIADAVFSGAELPDGSTAVFGTSSYQSETFHPDSNHLKIKLDVVFGGVEVIRQ
jgi:predicted membrane protein